MDHFHTTRVAHFLVKLLKKRRLHFGISLASQRIVLMALTGLTYLHGMHRLYEDRADRELKV